MKMNRLSEFEGFGRWFLVPVVVNLRFPPWKREVIVVLQIQ